MPVANLIGGKMFNAITGRDEHLLSHLSNSLHRARGIRFIVAFLMESGTKLLAHELEQAVQRDVPIKILTGKYLAVTEPSAIYLLKHRLGDRLDIRFVRDHVRSFHPKAYLFDFADDSEIYVGSSNISKTALTDGVEWNYLLKKSLAPDDYHKFSDTFDDLFENHSEVITEEVLRQYALSWRKSFFVRGDTIDEGERPEPVGAQIEALYELKKAREEGIAKGLVVAATGVGKTYLSAFDSVGFRKVLFVAHREEILHQAAATYEKVRNDASLGFFYNARKDEKADICFATVQTLGNHLDNFKEDSFDYLVVDEFHHAAADSYLKILEHFKPRFLLGLTATPYRMDNRDIFALCDDNVIYEIYLKDAINRDLLVPFRYYGVYDETDYNRIAVRSGRYVVEDLERELSRQERADLVLNKYRQMAGERAMGFCANIAHAEYMAQYFCHHGIPAVAVHSNSGTAGFVLKRKEAIESLSSGKIKVVFCVDMFNEGVDIPSLDTVLFLRPTESFVVFLQQLGRGLRKFAGKQYLTVLDFIGNYKRAHYLPALLSGDNPLYPQQRGRKVTDLDYPLDCQVQFDFRVLDLFVEMAKADPLKKRMEEDYFRLKEELKRRPWRLDVYEGSDIPFREYTKSGWLRFLQALDQLTEEEKSWLGTPAEAFLRELEKTSMTKSFKIPTLLALLSENGVREKASLTEIGKEFSSFFKDYPLHKKDMRHGSNLGWEHWPLEKFMKVARDNPVRYLSGSKFFHYDEVNRVFSVDESVRPYLAPSLASHMRDILSWRRINYFRRRFREEE